MIILNGHYVRPTIFPDRTSQVWKLPEELLGMKDEELDIVWQFESEAELLHLAQLKYLLDHYRHDYPYDCKLTITYLPYARQDKWPSNTSTFALQSFAPLLNSLKFNPVVIHDPHSKLALSLIKNSQAWYPQEELTKAIVKRQSDIICYPDKGALTKYREAYHSNFPYMWGEKVRDQLTGQITSYEIFGNVEGRKVMIVDDICDGGATFVLLAQKLLTSDAKEVSLFVTHGLFTKGTDILQQAGIHHIFTKLGERVDY